VNANHVVKEKGEMILKNERDIWVHAPWTNNLKKEI